MHPSRKAIALTLALALASGCSTRPRNFAAAVSNPVSDRTAFESDYRTCQKLVTSGRNSNFKAAAATALATGVGTVGTGMAFAASGAVGITSSGGAALASAAMPVVGVLVGFGVSRAIRSGKERKYKRLMSSCLAEYGYTVEGWEKLKKKQDAASIAATQVKVQEPAAAPSTEALAALTPPPS